MAPTQVQIERWARDINLPVEVGQRYVQEHGDLPKSLGEFQSWYHANYPQSAGGSSGPSFSLQDVVKTIMEFLGFDTGQAEFGKKFPHLARATSVYADPYASYVPMYFGPNTAMVSPLFDTSGASFVETTSVIRPPRPPRFYLDYLDEV